MVVGSIPTRPTSTVAMQYPLYNTMSLHCISNDLTSSDSYEVSVMSDTEVKPTLIKCLIKLLVILIITVLAVFPLSAGAHVSEKQEPTYSPEVEQVNTATTTQPIVAEVIATTTMTYEEYVIEEILKVFPDAPIMVTVARCESGLNPLADRSNLNVDVGLFQINQVHKARLAQLGLDRRNLHDNLTYARMLYDESGLGPWYMSKHCWG